MKKLLPINYRLRSYQTLSVVILVLLSYSGFSQVTTDPAFPVANEPITFTIDVTGTGLEGYSGDVWIWTWIDKESGDIDAPTNVNPATDAQSDAKMTRSDSDPNIYTITFTPTAFFDQPASEITRIGLLLKGSDWSDGQTQDFFVDISTGFEVAFTSPTETPVFLNSGESISIAANASDASTLEITQDGAIVQTAANATSVSYLFTAALEGQVEFVVTADNSTEIVRDTTYVVVRGATIQEPRPAGIIPGINYDAADPTTVTLSLLAPQKESVYVIGDFNDWQVSPEYQMKQDGEYFWLTITGLEPGKQYGFQYLVDESIYIADPYADMILDPDDQYIPEQVYPGLKPYPEQARNGEWYFNRVSVLETGQEDFAWQHEKPQVAVDSLIIYELLIRDFFEDGERTYANLIDTLSYLKGLGINAIELMPVMEFNGNNSWGYNPTFMFAPDKYYGPKEDLKRFIDAAHGMDMVVILDIAINHNDIPNSYLAMYFDYNTFTPTADNPWFNVEAKHPFNVFYDFDHESPYTQSYLDTINYYWLNEYRVDGFRYDLSKGFTQVDYGDNVGAWSSYDASRISLLNRMKTEIDSYDPDALLILEHFADNSEETELSADGFLLWGNLNYNYAQAAMGYSNGANVEWGYYENRGWSDPNLVTYMESHDEERISWKMKQFGSVTNDYSTRELEERMERLKATALFTYAVPGPKMMWQWGEWGYDIDINENGRTGIKPIPWNNIDGLDYGNSTPRRDLYNFYTALLNLRREHPVFSFGTATFNSSTPLQKQIVIRNDPYTDNPTDASQMNAVLVGNFDVEARTINVQLPHPGEWFSYFTSDDLSVSSSSVDLTLEAGEFRLFTDIELEAPDELVTNLHEEEIAGWIFYPNPATSHINIYNPGSKSSATITDVLGKNVADVSLENGNNTIQLHEFEKGVYLLRLNNGSQTNTYKFIKQ